MKRIYLLMTLVCMVIVSCKPDGGDDGYSDGGDNNNVYEYVDLGLSVKWATCNVGANSPEGYGYYFTWGETTAKKTYNQDNCIINGLTKSELQAQGYIDEAGNLLPQYDAATANWGGEWRMPTEAELDELNTKCTWTWELNGYKVMGPNGNSIFLPAAGVRYESSLVYAGSNGVYWGSTSCEGDDDQACGISFHIDDHYMGSSRCFYGRSVRPVVE